MEQNGRKTANTKRSDKDHWRPIVAKTPERAIVPLRTKKEHHWLLTSHFCSIFFQSPLCNKFSISPIFLPFLTIPFTFLILPYFSSISLILNFPIFPLFFTFSLFPSFPPFFNIKVAQKQTMRSQSAFPTNQDSTPPVESALRALGGQKHPSRARGRFFARYFPIQSNK